MQRFCFLEDAHLLEDFLCLSNTSVRKKIAKFVLGKIWACNWWVLSSTQDLLCFSPLSEPVSWDLSTFFRLISIAKLARQIR